MANVFSPVPAFNAKAASEAMNIVHMAKGGVSPTVYTFAKATGAASPGSGGSGWGSDSKSPCRSKIGGGDGGDGGTPPWAAAMLAEMRRSNRALEQFPTRLIAETRIGPNNNRRVTEWERIRSRNTISRKRAA